jgi:hypothetical protein
MVGNTTVGSHLHDAIPFSIHSSNITGIHTKLTSVAKMALSGIHAVTETKADEATQARASQELRALKDSNEQNAKLQAIWGEPTIERRSAGIAIFLGPAVTGRAERMHRVPAAAMEWRRSCRLEGFKFATQGAPRHATDNGLVIIYFFVLYGVYGDPAATNQLTTALDGWIFELGEQAPEIVVGDFNAETDELPVLRQWESTGASADVHRYAHEHLAKELGPTTSARRIDMMWANETAMLAVSDFSTSSHFATHETLHMSLQVEAYCQPRHRRHQPRPLPIVDMAPDVEDDILQHRQPKWVTHVSALLPAMLHLIRAIIWIPRFRFGPIERSATCFDRQVYHGAGTINSEDMCSRYIELRLCLRFAGTIYMLSSRHGRMHSVTGRSMPAADLKRSVR